MKKKLLIVSIVVIIVLLGSIVGILIYNNIQDKKEYSFSSFNLKRNVAKRSKNGDTIYDTLSADFDTGIFNPRSQSQLPEYIKVRD